MDDLKIWVLKKLKEKNNMSHRELARRGGCSNTLISDALKGARPITFDFCLAVAKGLNEPLWNVLKMGGFVEDIPPELLENEELRLLIKKYNSLSPPGKQELKKFLDWLILRDNE